MNNKVQQHNFGYGENTEKNQIVKLELKDEQDLKNYLFDIISSDLVDESNILFITSNILLLPNAMLKIEKI